MELVYVWLLVAAATFFAELGHPGLFLFLAISVGSLAAAGAAYLLGSLPFQLLVFIAVSVVSFYSLKKYALRQKTVYASNAHALIGATGLVTERIIYGATGRVRVKGEEWIARSLHGTLLEIGVPIQVIRIERTTLIVSSLK